MASGTVRTDDRITRHNAAMRRLVTAVQELSLARSLEDVMRIVRTAARELTGSDGATFVIREGENCFYADEEAIAPLWKGQRFPMTACISGWCMLNRLPATIKDIYADPRIPAQAYRPTFVKSLVMVPIRSSAPIGAIGNYWASPHTASPEEVEVIQALADTTAVAMENVRVYSELEERVRVRTEQLEFANKELEAFSYSVSHDLRNPLAAISASAEMLQHVLNQGLSEEQAKYVERICSSSKRMGSLIEDLLRLSHVSRTELKLERVDVSELARGIAEGLSKSDPERMVRVAITPEIQVVADRGMVKLVLENLLGNAWKYTAKQNQAHIILERDGL